MTPKPPDTYKIRLAKYQRREQMAVWVVAGVAALVGFVAARALDGAPRIFTQVVFTIAILAGAALAFARVGFEWSGTVLKRLLDASPELTNRLVPAEDKWPASAEACWDACRWLIFAGWIVMVVGIWWSRPVLVGPQPPPPVRAELQTSSIGSVSPFADCSVDLPPGADGQVNALVQKYRDALHANTRAALVILTGVADNRRLSPACAKQFGTNEHLAVLRATAVRTLLEPRFAKELLPPSYVVLTSGPRRLEAKGEQDGRGQDRAVDAWVAVDDSRMPEAKAQ